MGRYQTYGAVAEVEKTVFVHGLLRRDFVYSGPVVTHDVKPNEDLGVISYIHYDDPQYWWVIAWANDIRDPYLGFKAGDTLLIPTNLSVMHDMLENQS